MLKIIIIYFILISSNIYSEKPFQLSQDVIDQANKVFQKIDDLKNNMKKRHYILLKKIENKKATIQEIDEFVAYDSIFNDYTKEYLSKRDKMIEELRKRKSNNQSLFLSSPSFSID